jgi:hypothetical protein
VGTEFGRKEKGVGGRVDTKWRFQFFAKYDYRFWLDVIIVIIAMIIVIS